MKEKQFKIGKIPDGISLEEVVFTFTQEANCCDGGGIEEIKIEAKSSLGISSDGGAFFVLKTEQWAVDEPNSIQDLLEVCKKSVNQMIK